MIPDSTEHCKEIRRGLRRSLLILGVITSASLLASDVDYVKEIKPLFAERCYACHGTLQKKSGLRLDAGTLMLKGGNAGPAVIPGRADDSPLIHAVTGTHDMEIMPPEGSPLKEEEVAMLRRWINSGAKFPSDEKIPPDPSEHWAFKVPVRPAVPQVKNSSWVRNPVDAFVAREHERLKLAHKPEANAATLLRRVYLDLIGLPPTREQLSAFLKDSSSNAYEKVVDELLASPRYGERWGRHWMDVWRYSDWAGFGMEVRYSQPHIWRWRDWIIESLNEDKPYDRMIHEMLAADELSPDDLKALRATGYLARHYHRFNRNVWMDNVVEHTGKAFLGLTFNCAKCHDHKFDPILQKEYYQFRAFFEPYNVRIDRVPGQRDTTKDGFTRIFDANADAKTFLFHRGNDAEPDKDPLSAIPPKILGSSIEIKPVTLPLAVRYPDLRPFVIAEDQAALKNECEKAKSEITKAETALAAAQAAFDKSKEEKPAPPETPVAAAGPVFLHDEFDMAKPELWTRGAGQWEYKEGRLAQTQLGLAEHAVTSNADHPQDFSLRVKFKITGGTTYYSTGFHFDTNADSENSVYLSAHAPSPKAQISWRSGNNRNYPPAGATALPIRANQEYTLQVLVREQLMNVYVDEKLVLVYTLTRPRKAGRLVLWTYDATAEFSEINVHTLPTQVKLAEALDSKAASKSAASPAETLRKAQDAVPLARAKLAHAEAELASYAARLAAEQARFSEPPAPPADIESLAKKAKEMQIAAMVAKAEVDVLQAEQALAAAKAGGEKAKKIEEAEKTLAAKKKSVDDARAYSKPYSPIGAGPQPATSTGRRLALARWLTAKTNPLTARVAINHMWLRHFGEALVPSVFDFGLHGRKPANQDLLDWLACELTDRGWSMKAIHKLIVMSSTYRLQSTTRDDNEANRRIDPDNAYLWRANARRMEGEMVRDSILYLAGSLDLTTGGAEIDHMAGLTSNRRSLYFRHANEKQVLFLELFDAANPNECYRRNESIVPQQALALANSPLSMAQSRILAEKLTSLAGSGADAASRFITLACESILCRPPSSEEKEACAEFLSSQTKLFSDASALKRFDSGDAVTVKPSRDPQQRARENLVHVLFNHNDFVTIR
ncbi:MAG TPA: PSD1 and planctomycete cytochrome C domain-containing protein [Planctomycetota bacterium]|nr:PSD1 and planctomycete cytochrome C domain-containing protein [Planctomycetota bacterium]